MANVLIQGSGGGGQKLAPLTTPASADKIKSGKEAYTDAGVKLTGSYVESLPTLNAPTISVSGNVVTIVDGDNGTFSKTWEIFINNLPYRIIAHDGTYTFTELSDGTYSVKVKARGDGFNDSAYSNVETMTISSSAPIYGVSGLYSSTVALTRTDDAVGMSWTMSNNEISSDFDSVFPYNEMVPETINGDVFVKVPAIWWRVGYDANNYITDIAVSKDEMTAGTGQVVYKSDAFYYGAYKAYCNPSLSYRMLSISGRAVTYNIDRASFRVRAKNGRNASIYGIIDLLHLNIIRFLWLIEFATKDSASVMFGSTSQNGQTGQTNGLTAPSGQLGAQGRMRYRYIEDFIGNGFEIYDGMADLYVSDDFANYSDDLSQIGTAFSVGGAGANNEISAFGIVDFNNPLLAPPVETVANSSYNTYFCDYLFTGSTTFGYYYGIKNTAASGGLFYANTSTANGSYATSRLLYVPTT